MSIDTYNGASVIAMKGKECVAIASDLRFGVQNQTLACDFPKVFRMHDKLYLGLSGLATDIQTLVNRFRFQHNLYKLREGRNMRPETFAHVVSTLLYQHRFGPYFCEPIVAGLDEKNVPYITGMDSLGAMEEAKDFMVAGTAPASLWGVCESMYQQDLEPEELFEVVGQCLLSGVNRDALSGWGGIVYIICKDKVIERTLKGRQD